MTEECVELVVVENDKHESTTKRKSLRVQGQKPELDVFQLPGENDPELVAKAKEGPKRKTLSLNKATAVRKDLPEDEEYHDPSKSATRNKPVNKSKPPQPASIPKPTNERKTSTKSEKCNKKKRAAVKSPSPDHTKRSKQDNNNVQSNGDPALVLTPLVVDISCFYDGSTPPQPINPRDVSRAGNMNPRGYPPKKATTPVPVKQNIAKFHGKSLPPLPRLNGSPSTPKGPRKFLFGPSKHQSPKLVLKRNGSVMEEGEIPDLPIEYKPVSDLPSKKSQRKCLLPTPTIPPGQQIGEETSEIEQQQFEMPPLDNQTFELADDNTTQSHDLSNTDSSVSSTEEKEESEYLKIFRFYKEQKIASRGQMYMMFIPKAFEDPMISETTFKQLYARFDICDVQMHYNYDGGRTGNGIMKIPSHEFDDIARYAPHRDWFVQKLVVLKRRDDNCKGLVTILVTSLPPKWNETNIRNQLASEYKATDIHMFFDANGNSLHSGTMRLPYTYAQKMLRKRSLHSYTNLKMLEITEDI